MKIAAVIDPIYGLNPKKDTSLAILLEAQRRGFEVHILSCKDLGLSNGKAFGWTQKCTLELSSKPFFSVEEKTQHALSAFDIMFMRKDPPVDKIFSLATQILAQSHDKGETKVVNDPHALLAFNEKILATYYAQFQTETLVSQNLADLQSFAKQHKEVIVKPLDGMGGQSVFKTASNDGNFHGILESVSGHFAWPIMMQAFLPAIADGDKRILLIDGKPVEHVLARIPAKGEVRGNLAAGGRGEVRPLNDADRIICEKIAPFLQKNGLFFVGIDVIGDKLTEINITSPTCMQEISRGADVDVPKLFWDKLLKVV